MANIDPQLKQFYRQYVQQLTNPILPSGAFLLQPDIQKCLEDNFFDVTNTNFSPRYQANVLDRVIKRIESAVKDPEDDVVSDGLYECRASLAQAVKTNILQKKKIVYFPPIPFDAPDVLPIVIGEAQNIIGSGPNTGLRTWEACLRLAHYLWFNKSLIQNKNILELGAGTGFLSILCAGLLNAKRVIPTDGNLDVLRSLEKNINLNSNLFQTVQTPFPRQLQWEDEEGISSVLASIDQESSNSNSTSSSEPQIDLILGADITYHPTACIALADLLAKFIAINSATEIIISATERDKNTLADFLNICQDDEHELEVEEIRFECPDIHEQLGFFHTVAMPIRMFWIRQKK